MKLVICALMLFLQDFTATLTPEGKATWTGPSSHPGYWIGIYKPGAAVEPFPALWKTLGDGSSGSFDFSLSPGEWEARILTAANTVVATSPKVAVGVVAPDPVEPEAPQPRLRKLSYYEDGVLRWETETLDDTEASRHLTNFSLDQRRGVEAKIEVRYATVSYPPLPDEVGTWKK